MCREPVGDVDVGVALGQRCRQQGELAGHHKGLGFQAYGNVARDHTKAPRPAPHRLGQRSVVVARHEDPSPGEALHCVEEPTDRLVSHRLGVKHVAGDQDGIDTTIGRDTGQSLYHGKAGLEQRSRIVRLKLSEHSADLPVGRMQN